MPVGWVFPTADASVIKHIVWFRNVLLMKVRSRPSRRRLDRYKAAPKSCTLMQLRGSKIKLTNGWTNSLLSSCWIRKWLFKVTKDCLLSGVIPRMSSLIFVSYYFKYLLAFSLTRAIPQIYCLALALDGDLINPSQVRSLQSNLTACRSWPPLKSTLNKGFITRRLASHGH